MTKSLVVHCSPRGVEIRAFAQNTAAPGIVTITNVTMIDGTGAAPHDRMMLILGGGRIEYVGRVGEPEHPAGCTGLRHDRAFRHSRSD